MITIADDVRTSLERLRERGGFPATPVIRRFDVVPDHDSTGHPAFYIAVLVDDATPEEDLTLEKVRPIEDAVFDAVYRGPDERWPYVRTVREREYRRAGEEEE